jgi:hypothetical protein
VIFLQQTAPEFRDDIRSLRAFIRVGDFHRSASHDRVFGAVEHPLQRQVRCRKDAVEAGRGHAGGRRLEHPAPTLFARTQRPFRPLAI